MSLSDLAPLVWRANLSLAPTVILVASMRGLVRRFAGSDAVYLMWLIVPAGMIIAIAPPGDAVNQIGWLRSAPSALNHMGLWIAGVAVSFALVLIGHIRLMGLARRGKVGPAVIGWAAPRLYLPTDFEDRFDPGERAVIRAHERAHLLRWDAQANAAVTLLQGLLWCNPLAYLAARLFREDQEMSCDEIVLEIHPERRKLYARTLLKSQTAHWAPGLGCAFSRHPLIGRIEALSLRPSHYSRITLLIGLISLVAAAVMSGIVVYTDALKTPEVLSEPNILAIMHWAKA